jgi:hypothetical protein
MRSPFKLDKVFESLYSKKKGKAILVTGREGP